MATLDYELTIEERKGYLYACVESDVISFDMIIEYTNEIVQRLRQNGHERLLLHTETPVLGSTDCYEIASYIIRNAISRHVRIAIVDSLPGHARSQEQISKVSRTAGLDLRSFDSIDAGEAWLLKGNGNSVRGHRVISQ